VRNHLDSYSLIKLQIIARRIIVTIHVHRDTVEVRDLPHEGDGNYKEWTELRDFY